MLFFLLKKKGHICSFSQCILACIWGMLILTFGNRKIMEVLKNMFFKLWITFCSWITFSFEFLSPISIHQIRFFSTPLSNMWISHSGTTCLRLIKKIGLRREQINRQCVRCIHTWCKVDLTEQKPAVSDQNWISHRLLFPSLPVRSPPPPSTPLHLIFNYLSRKRISST